VFFLVETGYRPGNLVNTLEKTNRFLEKDEKSMLDGLMVRVQLIYRQSGGRFWFLVIIKDKRLNG